MQLAPSTSVWFCSCRQAQLPWISDRVQT